MNTTSITLLERLQSRDDQAAWERFVRLYTPMIYRWAMRIGLTQDVASELAQEVLTLLVSKLPQFHYNEQGSFRAWLRQVTLNRYRELNRHRRIHVVPIGDKDLPDPDQIEASQFVEEAEYRRELVNRAMKLIQKECSPETWNAFWEYVAIGRTAAEVAEKLGISVNSVYLAKSRVLKRLRAELDGLL